MWVELPIVLTMINHIQCNINLKKDTFPEYIQGLQKNDSQRKAADVTGLL